MLKDKGVDSHLKTKKSSKCISGNSANSNLALTYFGNFLQLYHGILWHLLSIWKCKSAESAFYSFSWLLSFDKNLILTIPKVQFWPKLKVFMSRSVHKQKCYFGLSEISLIMNLCNLEVCLVLKSVRLKIGKFSSNGSNTILSNIEGIWISFFEHQTI